MLNEKQIERMLGKLAKFEEKLGTMLFDKVDELPMLRTEECGPLDAPPADDAFRPFADGETWGGEGKYCWLKGCYTVPQEFGRKNRCSLPRKAPFTRLCFGWTASPSARSATRLSSAATVTTTVT